MAAEGTPAVQESAKNTGDKGLKRNAVGLPSVLSQSLANVGPTIGILFITGLVITKAGAAAPFDFILVMIGLGFTAWSVAMLCRYLPAASVLYAGPARAFGANVGLVIASVLFLIYMIETASTATFLSGLSHDFISEHGGVSIPWWLILIVVLGVYATLGWIGIHITLRVTILALVCELALIMILTVYVVIRGGHAGQVPAAFGPSLSPRGWSAIGAGFVFGIFALGGFESSAGTAEETRSARRLIPLAVIGSVVMGGLLFVFNSYALIVGYGTSNLGKLTSSTNPLVPLAVKYYGAWYGDLISLALISATIGASLASATLIFRLVYALGRDGVLPSALGRTHPKHRSPYISIVSISAFCLIFGLIVGAKWTAEGQFGILGYLTGIALGAAYLIFNIAMIVFIYRHYRSDFSVLKQGLPGVIGGVIVIIGLVPSFHPFPGWPFNLLVYILIGWVVVFSVVVYVLSKVRPGKTNQIVATAVQAEQSSDVPTGAPREWVTE
jgi:amino acid transporter